MSPTEDQLRAALSDGEGDGVSADRVIAQANEIRHRRVRYASVAATVAVVAGLGIGAGFVLNNHSETHSKTAAGRAADSVDSAAGNFGDNVTAGDGTAVGAAPNPVPASALPRGCPATLPTIAAVRSGTGSLFAGLVSSVQLCLYAEGGGPLLTNNGNPDTTTVVGADATQLAASLDAAETSSGNEPCPLYRNADGKKLLIIGFGADGTPMKPIEAVVDDNTCDSPITNGVAVRYNWTLPSVVVAFLAKAS